MMISHVLLTTACILLITATVDAQIPATTLAGAQSALYPDDKIRVVDRTGNQVEGRLQVVNSDSLTIAAGRSVTFREADIQQISRKRPESKWNGVAFGALTGLVASIVTVSRECGNDSECAFYTGLAAYPTMIGGGAAIGAVVDFFISRYDPVYVRAGSARRFRVAPLVGGGNMGLAVALSF
jgi:hypothetical protein